MAGAVIIVITIVACLYGYFANSYYQGKYNAPAADIGMLIIQSFFMLCVFLTIPNPDISGWFILWTILLIISYIVALLVCKQQCLKDSADKKDTIIALLTQAITPLGVALLIMVVIAIITGSSGKKKRR